jgi:hypothetical protein
MQSANFRPVDRHFGVVSKIFDDGACSIRRLDGQGEVMLDARHARRVGRDLLVGMRLEFEVKYVHGARRPRDVRLHSRRRRQAIERDGVTNTRVREERPGALVERRAKFTR